MVIAPDRTEARDSCTSKGPPCRFVSPEIGAPDVASLESLTGSLAAGEVARWRASVADEQRDTRRDLATRCTIMPAARPAVEPTESGSSTGTTTFSKIKKICRDMGGSLLESLDASRVVQKTRLGLEAAVVCIEKMCKVLRSEREDTASNSVLASSANSPVEKTLSNISRGISALRDWILDSGATQKSAIKQNVTRALFQYSIGDAATIPKVVLVQRRESKRSEGRRRTRVVSRRREPVVEDEDCCRVEDEFTAAPVRTDDRPISEEHAKEQRTSRAYRRIRDIDRQYGTKPSNPKVAELLAQLGTPYDSVERAIELVYALQQEELLEAQREEIETLTGQMQVLNEMVRRGEDASSGAKPRLR